MYKTRVWVIALFFGLAAATIGIVLISLPKRTVVIDIPTDDPVLFSTLVTEEILNPDGAAEDKAVAAITPPKVIADIEPQKPLLNPPKTIKALYATNWSMSNQKKKNYLLDLIDKTELNAIVIDIKDYAGVIPYATDLKLANKYKAVEVRIPRINQLIKNLHARGIYAIGRLSVFQDLALAKARPDLALISSSTGKTWTDHKGLTWMDPSIKEVWDYNIAIAHDALDRGFDEINFDYIRFASDGQLSDIVYPHWDEKTLKTKVIRNFFKYLREKLGAAPKLSVDLFGLTTVNRDGLGIGQSLEYALPYFDAIAPMVYPSHYFPGFIGLENPADFPYEVVRYSMDRAIGQIKTYKAKAATTTPPVRAKLRPWLQDFDLGADYDAKKVRAQITAWNDAASSTPEAFSGWMVWNAANRYTKEALLPK